MQLRSRLLDGFDQVLSWNKLPSHSKLFHRTSASSRTHPGPFRPIAKIQKSDAPVATCLMKAQRDQVIRYSSLGELPVDKSPVLGKRLDGVFSVIVVPRYPVVIEKDKQLFPIPYHPLSVPSAISEAYEFAESIQPPIHFHLVFSQEPPFQTMVVDRIHDLAHQCPQDLAQPPLAPGQTDS